MLVGLRRRGAVAPGGACRLVRAADGWLAVHLARDDDVVLADAWLGGAGLDASTARGAAWRRIAALVASAPASELAARAVPLGLAVSALAESADHDDDAGTGVVDADADASAGATVSRHERAVVAPRPFARPPVVVDLSSLWAGPLCARLLGASGARVIKVESIERPDGARGGSPGFFDRLHHGHESVALPFRSAHGRAALGALLAAADMVIEASRHRTLEQLGIDAHTMVARGAIWLSITAYGRIGAHANRVGFGDDVAIAAGLYTGTNDAPMFCGDAIADPITGLAATVAATRALQRGAPALIDMSMAAATCAARGADRRPERCATRTGATWSLDGTRVQRPRAGDLAGAAAPLGADTDRVLREFGIPPWD